jgi:hypothetical protein
VRTLRVHAHRAPSTAHVLLREIGRQQRQVSRDPGASCHVLRLQILFLFLRGVRRALPQPTVPKLYVRSQQLCFLRPPRIEMQQQFS